VRAVRVGLDHANLSPCCDKPESSAAGRLLRGRLRTVIPFTLGVWQVALVVIFGHDVL
jgi:hypothetical protein